MTKICIASIFLALSLLACLEKASGKTFDITKYGAKSDGDISQALLKAWTEAVALSEPVTVVIPKGTWQLSQVKLLGGKGKSPSIHLKVEGTLKAPQGCLPDKEADWVTINYVENLEISGGGVFDGQGQETWKKNDYHLGSKSKIGKTPINLSLNFLNHSHIHDVTIKDSKNFQVNLMSSYNVTFKRFTISAPGDSPNTDGIHVARSTNIHFIDSTIETGDDCISIGDESKDYHITNVKCGPGHGISIGSLGKNPKEKDVTGIYVKNCTFKGTEHGVRIKTWPSAPGEIVISDLHFEDLIMENVGKPIIFDQEYCPHNLCKLDAPSKIQIRDVTIKDIRGTSSTPEAVVFSCSSAKPCEGVKISNIDLTYNGKRGSTTSICKNIKPKLSGKQNPSICGVPSNKEDESTKKKEKSSDKKKSKKDKKKKEEESSKKTESPKNEDL